MIQFSLLKYFRLHFMTFLRSNEILFSIAVSHTHTRLCSSINTETDGKSETHTYHSLAEGGMNFFGNPRNEIQGNY